MNDTCNICGNPVPREMHTCPYCGSFDMDATGTGLSVGRIDIGHQNLTVLEAVSELEDAITGARSRGDTVLIIIHGRGASGAGGQIKSRVRETLAKFRSNRQIRTYIPGEHFHRKGQQARELISAFPGIDRLDEWGSQNSGISVVIL